MKQRKTRNPTVHDVAKLAGVGLMTVSRVLNNQPVVRQSTRKRVLSAIQQLGYKRNEAARMLKGLPTMMIGLIVPDLSDSFFASCAQTVQLIARAHGFMTLVAASERDSELEIEQAQLMASRNLSGIVVATSTRRGDGQLKNLQDAGLKIVAFDRPIEGLRTDSVVVENRRGSEEAVRHLLQHGHKRISCIGYDEGVYTTMERVEGYSHAVQAAGCKPNIVLNLRSPDDVEKWIGRIRGSKDRPTAIFTVNHVTSYRALVALSRAKMSMPKDIAFIGFGDFELAAEFSPPITVVAQSAVDIAKRAMSLLIDRIKHDGNRDEFVPATIVQPTTLIVRASCGCNQT